MAVGNGDERQAAAWERVEAKVDRLGERLGELRETVLELSGTVAEHTKLLAQLVRFAEMAELRLKRLEDNAELTRLLIEAVRHEVDEKIERFEERLLSKLGREMRVELLAAQTLNDDRVTKLERRVDALEAARA
jgi:predicted membrane chloride channel (bestrophin family)